MELDTVVCGDCLDVMAEMPSNFVSTVLTDPPYGLSKEPDMVEVLTHWLAGDDYEHRGGGFMGKTWDSFVPGPSVWREVYRVMKPGGTLLAFGGTRTNDLLSIAIRLAGFQKFDEIDYYYGGLPPQMAWVTGQGFPKSLALDKAVDKYLGKDGERKIVGKKPWKNQYIAGNASNGRGWMGVEQGRVHLDITAPATEAAALWSGYGTGLKPAHEVILCFYKPREGSYANNALAWGVAGLWIDGGRVATGDDLTRDCLGLASANHDGWKRPWNDEAEKRRWGSTNGRWPANLLLQHADGCRRRGTRRVRGEGGLNIQDKGDAGWFVKGNGAHRQKYHDPDGYEQVDDWECVESCPCRILGEQSGERRSAGNYPTTYITQDNNKVYQVGVGNTQGQLYADHGTAARFFYQAKASRNERNLGCQDVYWRKDKSAPVGFVRIDKDEWEALPEKQRARGNIHPTVKPLGVMEYLCTLTKTPTGGVVFDPFCGTGTTALGAIKTGRRWLCCDISEDYVYLANLRIEALRREMPQMELSL